MAVNFSSDPSAVGFAAPARFEADVFDCEVWGQIPKDLDGAFYRAVTDWFYPPRHKDDAGPFNADGYVGMFRFQNGSVDYKGRYVRTERYLADRKARKQLFGNYRNRFTDDPSVSGVNRTVANTSLFHHAGQLWVLKEDALPTVIDPNTLETKGPWDFHGKYASKTFTAHPKTDPRTGEMICYGYEATGDLSDDVYVYFVDKAGHVRREVRFKAPLVSMMHDIVITEKHIVFNTCGFVTNAERLKAGKVHWAWDSTVPTYVGILPRDGDGKDVRWFKGPVRAAIHMLNGVTKDNKVILETPVSDGNPFPFFPAADGSPWNPQKARTTLRRWTFDLNSKHDGWEEQVLFPEAPGVLPRIDERYWSLPYRYGYVGYADPSKPFDEKAGNLRGRVTNCYARLDFATGKMNSYFVGDVGSLQEVQFIPRRKDAPEGDGYLIGIAANYAEMHSELVIIDAQRLEEGDIARVILPFRVAPQVHGWWVGADQLPLRPTSIDS
jgi:carotenoid cleavage dioxygenase-like enzyme